MNIDGKIGTAVVLLAGAAVAVCFGLLFGFAMLLIG